MWKNSFDKKVFCDVLDRIALQEELRSGVLSFVQDFDFSSVKEILDNMRQAGTAACAYNELKEILKDDDGCIKMLACQLLCATEVLCTYRRLGIPDSIFDATMGCFSRFIAECHKKTGHLAFDRGWWTYRQLSMTLFRLGQLEFELTSDGLKKEINIHIPSDAVLSQALVDDSLREAAIFLRSFYPDFVGANFVCNSWLMSPLLKEILEDGSRILSFQSRFEIISRDDSDLDFIEWLFGADVNSDYTALPEETSLQRKAKALLLAGKPLGSGVGVLTRNPCSQG